MVLRWPRFSYLISFELAFLLFLSIIFSAWIRLLMTYVPFRYYEFSLGQRGEIDHNQPLSEYQERKILLVRQVLYSVGMYLPWARKCLVKALAAKWLLKRYGISSTLYFGTHLNGDVSQNIRLLAHAWLTIGDRFITGQKGHKQFKIVNVYS